MSFFKNPSCITFRCELVFSSCFKVIWHWAIWIIPIYLYLPLWSSCCSQVHAIMALGCQFIIKFLQLYLFFLKNDESWKLLSRRQSRRESLDTVLFLWSFPFGAPHSFLQVSSWSSLLIWQPLWMETFFVKALNQGELIFLPKSLSSDGGNLLWGQVSPTEWHTVPSDFPESWAGA